MGTMKRALVKVSWYFGTETNHWLRDSDETGLRVSSPRIVLRAKRVEWSIRSHIHLSLALRFGHRHSANSDKPSLFLEPQQFIAQSDEGFSRGHHFEGMSSTVLRDIEMT